VKCIIPLVRYGARALVRTRLPAGEGVIRTLGPPREGPYGRASPPCRATSLITVGSTGWRPPLPQPVALTTDVVEHRLGAAEVRGDPRPIARTVFEDAAPHPTPEQSLKAQIYLANIEDAPDCLDAWNQYYAGIPCAVTVVPTKSFATVGGIVEINLIALTNGAARKKQVVETDIPGMAAYGPCIKVGEFLLPSGLIAIGRDGHIAGRTISPGFAGLAHAGHIQAEAISDYAEALCQAAGTTMAKLLRAQYFVADVAVFPGVAMAWSTRFGRPPHPFVCVQTPTPMPAPGTAVIADFWISTLQ
jgi:enamine deaminase RidA (YjgF/YER057c/UK114 family)